MRYIPLYVFLLVVCSFVAPAQPAKTADGQKKVYVLPIKGPIDKSMLYVFRRAFREAEKNNPAAVIIKLDTPGGRLLETREILKWIRATKKRIPVYAFVSPDALSAGAMISLGTTAIFMSPDATIGSAMPISISITGNAQPLPDDIKEKMLSAVRAMVRSLAQENEYNEDLAEAMVDPAKEVKIGDQVVSAKGQLLNLTAREAIAVISPETKPLLARAIVPDIATLLKQVDLEGAEVITFQEESSERLARWIAALGPLLLALGLIGIYIEIKTPGFGIPGISGIICLSIYFFGHYVAGLAGAEEMILVFIGILLLILEIFVIPGFGVAGVLGLLCIGAGCLLALIPHLPTVQPLPNVAPLTASDWLEGALLQLFFTVVLVGVGVWLLGKILPKTSLYNVFVLDKKLSTGEGFVSHDVERYAALLGAEGITQSQLRPVGIAEFGEKRMDVVSSGDFIPSGSPVRVVEVSGRRVVVELIPESEETPV